MHWFVIAAGEMRCQAYWQSCLNHNPPILCADAGLKHCEKLGIQPRALIGDFDSYPNPKQPIESIILNKDKEESDSQAAIELAFNRGAAAVTLLGGAGTRLDHSLANFNLLALYPGKLTMADGDYEALAIQKQHQFESELNATCSLLPFGMTPTIVTTQGLRFGLDREQLRPDSHGLSNQVIARSVKITVHSGMLILIRVWEPYSNRQPLKS
jgi:thiamine pyrophosphokinase